VDGGAPTLSFVRRETKRGHWEVLRTAVSREAGQAEAAVLTHPRLDARAVTGLWAERGRRREDAGFWMATFLVSRGRCPQSLAI
jgi:hypothetical protein